MADDESVRELTIEECWEFLGSQELGRLAFRLVDDVHIAPVNYVVDDRTLLFRTDAGDKLFGVELGAGVAFEVDEVVGETACSVVVRGTARRLPENEEHRADQLPLHTWVGMPKYYVVEVRPEEVTGRRFDLHRPWLRMLPSV
jgi:nitroimidazol reductase NimA-like FMN-containing flavoprotein (pyridoxamine 5'-phosphate oxidase superfamily)